MRMSACEQTCEGRETTGFSILNPGAVGTLSCTSHSQPCSLDFILFLPFSILVLWARILSYSTGRDRLKVIFLSQPPECRSYRDILLCLVCSHYREHAFLHAHRSGNLLNSWYLRGSIPNLLWAQYWSQHGGWPGGICPLLVTHGQTHGCFQWVEVKVCMSLQSHCQLPGLNGLKIDIRKHLKLDIVAHICNSSTVGIWGKEDHKFEPSVAS